MTADGRALWSLSAMLVSLDTWRPQDVRLLTGWLRARGVHVPVSKAEAACPVTPNLRSHAASPLLPLSGKKQACGLPRFKGRDKDRSPHFSVGGMSKDL